MKKRAKDIPANDTGAEDTTQGTYRRAFWSGTISFGLVSIPVDFYSATRSRTSSLRLLTEDGHPVGRRYFCPSHDAPAPNEEIVRGKEVAPGEFVVISDEELEAIAPEKTRDIDLMRFVPVSELPTPLFARAYVLAPSGESTKAYRLLAATMEQSGEAGIATYVWSNWKDEPTSQALIAARNLSSRVLVGPGSHCVPPEGFDLSGEIVRYFDYHLKGIDNGFSAQPPVTYWVDAGNGDGFYRRAQELPGEGSLSLAWYLGPHRDGAKGTLARKPSAGEQDEFTVDYDLPDGEYFAFWPAPPDDNGIVYDSAPLDAPLDLLGYPVAQIALSADREDAEVFVYLEEVSPSGEVEVLSFGRLKLSHRALAEAPWDNLGLPWHSGLSSDVAPLAKGETARLAIAMMPLSRRVEAGSRLRFVLAGADPRQRNLADVRQDPPPRFTIHTGWEAGSRVELPLAPAVVNPGAEQAADE